MSEQIDHPLRAGYEGRVRKRYVTATRGVVMPVRWTGSWVGGRTRVVRGINGRRKTVWVLERMMSGARYVKSLEARNEREALAELLLFERDPQSYANKPNARVAVGDVVMNASAVQQYLDFLKSEGRTEKHRRDVKKYLIDWSEVFLDRDLRTLTLRDVKRELNRWQDPSSKRVIAKKHRIASLKGFFSWLREEEAAISPAEDPTLSLKVPPSRPEKMIRDKGYEIRDIERLYRAMSGSGDAQLARDALVLHAKCGLHDTEIERLAKGEGEVRVVRGHGEIAGTIRFVHKSGRVHLQSVDAQTLAAALRLQESRGKYNYWILFYAIRAAADSLGRKAVNLGELRHSVVTWGRNYGEKIRPTKAGVTTQDMAEFIGHSASRTTKFFYDGTKVPPMIKIPIRLHNPQDPAPLGIFGQKRAS